MEKLEFTKIVMKEGLTEAEAAWLWAGNPEGNECLVEPERLAEGIVLIMPELNILRTRPDHETSMNKYLMEV